MRPHRLLAKLAGRHLPVFPAEWAGDNRQYVPFIILGSERTGSSLLVQTLRSHPDVVSFGEVLNPVKIGYNTPGFENWRGVRRRARDLASARFMDTGVFCSYRDGIAAVGCKIFYDHVESPTFAPARARLLEMRNLKVIHLERRNLLRTYLSLVIARRTLTYGTRSIDERTRIRVQLSPTRCADYFTKLTTLRARYARLFAERHQVLDVVYEDFVADRSTHVSRLQRFLDLKPASLRATIIQQEVRPLPEAIENYAALKDHFAATRWSVHFDE